MIGELIATLTPALGFLAVVVQPEKGMMSQTASEDTYYTVMTTVVSSN